MGVVREKGCECDLKLTKEKPTLVGEGEVEMEKFVPVMVKGGRKFRGEAYDIGADIRYNSFHLCGWSGRGGYVHTETIKLWSPTEGFVYCNPNYVEDRVADEEHVKADFAKYVDCVLESTMEWCRSKSQGKGDAEVIRFAFNVVRKNNPHMIPMFSDKYGYTEDISDTILSTVLWAIGLGYRSDKSVRIAYRALVKKGIVKNPQFRNAWIDVLNSRCLGKYAERYAA